MNVMKLGMKYIKKYKVILLAYITLLIINNVLSLILPYVRGSLIDQLIIITNLNDMLIYIYIIFSIVIIQTISNYFIKMIYTKIQVNSGYSLNVDILNHMKKLPISFFSNKDFSYLNQRINNDSNQIIIFSINIISDFIVNSIMLLISIYLMIKISIIILFIAICIVACYVILYKLMKNIIYEKQFVMKEKQSIFFAILFKQISCVKFFKLHSAYNIFDKILKQSKEDLYNAAIKNQQVDYVFSNIENLLTTIAMTLVLIIGANEVIKGNLSIGIFTVLTSYFSVFISSTHYFIGLGSNYQSVLVCFNRISEILLTPEVKDGDVLIDKIDSIELKNVSFSYDDKPLINNLSVKFEKNKIYCVIGKNATGKSTLLDIILGIYLNENTGNIFFNSLDIKNINMVDTIKKHIAFVEQQPFVIEGYTYLDNFNIYLDGVDNEKANELLELLKLDKNTNKNKFSGGEKQKIAIIRELIQENHVILLDEPTSSLDTTSKKKLIEYLNSIKENKIIIMVTHDSELLNVADEVLDISKLK